MTPLDKNWLLAHPLPNHEGGTDKNARGRVLLAGGGEFVPGALRLSGEAALRAGAGKLQMATVHAVATALGVLIPEAAMIALPADEEGIIGPEAAPILLEAAGRCDAFVFGPGMVAPDRVGELVERVLGEPRPGLSLVLDAAVLACAADLEELIAAHGGRVLLTPHHREMAKLSGMDEERIADDPEHATCEIAERFGAVVVLKSARTVIAAPGQPPLIYGGGGVGLATGGSGDVLAGIAGGLLSRGTEPLAAAAWAVWLHGEAGRAAAAEIGPIGFLARDLLPHIPRLMTLD